MLDELLAISARCDGVRCDMAMLILPDVFERTWGRRPADFWSHGHRAGSRSRSPGFCFMAEVYWDLEWTMLQHGFDYAYDKRLYDRLREGAAGPVRDHLAAGLDYQDHLARFLENHDEPRAAATFPPGQHEAAAVVTYLSPGLRFFHQGQLEGRRVRISPHLVRAPTEPVDETPARVLRPPAGRAPAPGRPGRRLAPARGRARLGGQRLVGRLHRLGLARPTTASACSSPSTSRLTGPVLRPAALRGAGRPDRPAARCAW